MSLDAIKALETRVTVLETKSAVDEVHRGNVEKRLGEMEDTLKWLVRLMVGAIIMAFLT